MNIVLLDLSDVVYSLASLDGTPLSGSQTMLCLLARTLASRGHGVCLAGRHIMDDRTIGGVRHINARTLIGGTVPAADAVIVLNNTTAPANVRRIFGDRCRVLYWMHNDSTSASAETLADPAYTAGIDGLVFVSAWQARRFAERFALSIPCHVIGNALMPVFQDLFPAGTRILEHKDPGLIVYASAPNRGLEGLAQLFPYLRAARPGLRLEVFSGFVMDQGVYFDNAGTQHFEDLLAHLAGMDGVRVARGVNKAVFAQRLKQAAVLCYPCTFPETSSISVMEAMAAGCGLCLTGAGALEETSAGFARIVPFTDGTLAGQMFIDATLDTLDRIRIGSPQTEALLQAQAAYARTAFSWEGRYPAWESALAGVAAF